jgi:hypothetical protein
MSGSELLQLCQEATHLVSFGGASQEELDVLGELLDRLEVVEAFLDTNCSYQDRRDAEVEFNTLTDRISTLVEKV